MMVRVCHKMQGDPSLIYLHGWTVVGQCIYPWMDGSRTTHMYRMYGSRVTHGAVTEEQLSRSSEAVCRKEMFYE